MIRCVVFPSCVAWWFICKLIYIYIYTYIIIYIYYTYLYYIHMYIYYVYIMYILCIYYVYIMCILCIYYVYIMYILCIYYVYIMYILCVYIYTCACVPCHQELWCHHWLYIYGFNLPARRIANHQWKIRHLKIWRIMAKFAIKASDFQYVRRFKITVNGGQMHSLEKTVMICHVWRRYVGNLV